VQIHTREHPGGYLCIGLLLTSVPNTRHDRAAINVYRGGVTGKRSSASADRRSRNEVQAPPCFLFGPITPHLGHWQAVWGYVGCSKGMTHNRHLAWPPNWSGHGHEADDGLLQHRGLSICIAQAPEVPSLEQDRLLQLWQIGVMGGVMLETVPRQVVTGSTESGTTGRCSHRPRPAVRRTWCAAPAERIASVPSAQPKFTRFASQPKEQSTMTLFRARSRAIPDHRAG
jgi:hypothetical protein